MVHFLSISLYTDSIKVHRPGEFLSVENIFEKSFKEVCSPHLYASFGTSLTEKRRLSGASRSEQMFEHTVVPPNSRELGNPGIKRLNNSSKPFQPKVATK